MTASLPARDLRDAMVDTFIRQTQAGRNIAVVVSDSTSTSKISAFADAFPERVINVGIAEQSLVGVAAGLALGGFVAVTANAAPFLVGRANEQVKNDICYSRTNVKLVGLNAGVAYGPLASTHHAIDDLSIMRGFGNILITAPSDAPEAEQIFDFALAHDGPVYIRLDNIKFPTLHDAQYSFVAGAPDVLRPGRDVVVFAIGSVVCEAVAAHARLAEGGVTPTIVNLSCLRPLDRAAVAALIARHRTVVTVEEHSINGGLGSTIAEIIAEGGLGVRLKRIGIADGSFAKAGPRASIRAYHGLDADGISKAVLAAAGV